MSTDGTSEEGIAMSEIEIRLALAERAIEEIKHRARNDRQASLIIESELEHARREIVAIKAKLYGGLSVAVGSVPFLTWIFSELR
jgi:hypothetical protein